MSHILQIYNSIKKDPHYIGYNNIDWYYETIGEIDIWVNHGEEVEPPFKHYFFNSSSFSSLNSLIRSIPIGTLVAIRLRLNPNQIIDSVRDACLSIGSSEVLEYMNKSMTNLNIIGYKGSPVGTAMEKSSEDISVEVLPRINDLPRKLEIEAATGEVLINGIPVEYEYNYGLNVFLLTSNFDILNIRSFDTINDKTANEEFVLFIESQLDIPTLLILIVARTTVTGKDLKLSLDSSSMIVALGSKFFPKFYSNDKYWFILSSNSKSICEYSMPDLPGVIPSCSGSYIPFNDSLNFGTNVIIGSRYESSPYFSEFQSFIEIEGFQKGLVQYCRGFSMTIMDEVTSEILGSYEIILDPLGPFNWNQLSPERATEFILNEISIGSVVIIVSSRFLYYDEFPSYLIEAFRTLGSSLQTHQISPKSSYLLLGRKGCPPGSVLEKFHPTESASCLNGTFAPYNKMVKPYLDIKIISKGWVEGFVGMAKFYLNSQIVDLYSSRRGLNVMIINPANGKIENMDTFDTYLSSSESDRFVQMIKETPIGSIVAIAVQDEASKLITDEALNTIKTYLGGTKFTKSSFRASYSIIGEMGNPFAAIESYCPVENGINFPAICVKKLPVKSVYLLSNPIFKKIKIDSSMDIFVDNIQQSKMIENVKIWVDSIPVVDVDLYGLISNLPIYTIVVATINGKSISERSKLALSMIGASKINLALSQQNTSYCIVGRKGFSPGSALELYSKDYEVISLSTYEPKFSVGDQRVDKLTSTGFYTMVFNREYYYSANYESNMGNFNLKKGMKSLSGNNYDTRPCYTISEKEKKRNRKDRVFKVLIVGYEYNFTDSKLPDLSKETTQHYFAVWRHLLYLKLVYPDSIIIIKTFVENAPELVLVNSIPLKANILFGFNWLRKDNQSGDVLYFMFNGHGYQYPEEIKPDLSPHSGIVMLTTSTKTHTLAMSDLWGYINHLNNPVPEGVNLSMFLCCCFSENLLRYISDRDPILSHFYPVFSTSMNEVEILNLQLCSAATVGISQDIFVYNTYQSPKNPQILGPVFGNKDNVDPNIMFLLPLTQDPSK
eukprot:gene10347-12708_t